MQYTGIKACFHAFLPPIFHVESRIDKIFMDSDLKVRNLNNLDIPSGKFLGSVVIKICGVAT